MICIMVGTTETEERDEVDETEIVDGRRGVVLMSVFRASTDTVTIESQVVAKLVAMILIICG